MGDVGTFPFSSCPLFVPGVSHGFDMRMFSPTHPWEFDTPYEVEALLIDDKEGLEHLVAGASFTIWEGLTIGFGNVINATWSWPRATQTT